MRLSRRVAALATAAAALFGGLGLVPSAASAASGYGYDVSYPQCGKTLPSAAAFAVIGVNGGQPLKDNRCLGEQFRWVRRVNADYGFYVNSSNPGRSHPQWGKPGELACGGAAAEWGCGYNFGQAVAKDAFDHAERVTKAASGHRFWVDVET